jgi:hypothetical protein
MQRFLVKPPSASSRRQDEPPGGDERGFYSSIGEVQELE